MHTLDVLWDLLLPKHVEGVLWEQEVPGSNPGAPIGIKSKPRFWVLDFAEGPVQPETRGRRIRKEGREWLTRSIP